MTENDLDQLFALKNKFHGMQGNWYREILTISVAGLTVLVGLDPELPSGIGKYFLAATWAFLGTGILAGATATYADVSRAGKLAESFRAALLISLREQRRLTIDDVPTAEPGKLFVLARPIAIGSILLAVVSLVAFAVFRTIGV